MLLPSPTGSCCHAGKIVESAMKSHPASAFSDHGALTAGGSGERVVSLGKQISLASEKLIRESSWDQHAWSGGEESRLRQREKLGSDVVLAPQDCS